MPHASSFSSPWVIVVTPFACLSAFTLRVPPTLVLFCLVCRPLCSCFYYLFFSKSTLSVVVPCFDICVCLVALHSVGVGLTGPVQTKRGNLAKEARAAHTCTHTHTVMCPLTHIHFLQTHSRLYHNNYLPNLLL